MTAPAEDSVSLRAWAAVLGGVVGCFMAGMNVHVTNASLPDVRGSLGASFEEGSWITTAYLVAEIIVIPLAGWLVSVFSMRRVLMVGTGGFVLFSIVCSMAPDTGAPLRRQALSIIAGAIHREALLLAYSDAFLIAGGAMVLCAAGGMLLKGKKPAAGS